MAEGARHDPAFPQMVDAAFRLRELLRALADRREELGLSQTTVAARMGTSQSSVARLEAGEADARLSTVERFAAALERWSNGSSPSPVVGRRNPPEGGATVQRSLTDVGRAIVERLLSPDFRDVEYFRAQVPALTVTDVCGCGCGSLTFEVDADRAIRAPSQFWREGSQVLVEGDRKSWLMLFQHDGRLSELEHVAGHGPNPNDLDASKIKPDVQIEESWFDER